MLFFKDHLKRVVIHRKPIFEIDPSLLYSYVSQKLYSNVFICTKNIRDMIGLIDILNNPQSYIRPSYFISFSTNQS